MGPQQVGVAISHASLSLAPHCLLRQLLPTPRLSSLLRSAQDEGHDDDNADLAFGHSHAHANAHLAHSMTPIPFTTGGGGNPHLTCGSGHLSSGSLGMDAGHSVGWVVQPSLDWPRAQVSRARGGGAKHIYGMPQVHCQLRSGMRKLSHHHSNLRYSYFTRALVRPAAL